MLDVLKLINTSQASCPDSVHAKLLTEVEQTLSKHSKIFNSSLSSSYFLSQWKLANVVPVYKEGDKTDTSNYRPISPLCIIDKVFVKCVFK